MGADPQVKLGDPFPRWFFGALAALGSILGLLGAVAPPGLAVVGAIALAALVPGALIVNALPALPRLLALASVPAVGLATVSLAVSGQLAAGLALPHVMYWIFVGAGAVGGFLLLRSDWRGLLDWTKQPNRFGRRSGLYLEPAAVGSLTLGLVGTVCWLAAMPGARTAEYSSYGLAFQAPLLIVGVLLCAIGALWAITKLAAVPRRAFDARAHGLVWALIFLLVLARRGYTFFATEGPLYLWTYRHLGVMDWFNHSGTLARDVDVYNNWPAALALWSWVSDVSGFSRFELGAIYTVGHHLVLLLAVYALARAAGLTSWQAYLGAVLVELADWTGQDYLSPQSFAWLLAIIVIALALASRDSRYRRGCLGVAFILFAAVAWAHQLTPVWLIFVLTCLAVLNVLRPRWAIAPFLAILALTLLLNIESLLANNTGVSLELAANAAGNIETVVSSGQAFTSRIVTILAATLWGTAALVAAVRLWRTRAGLVAPLIAFSPFVLLVTGYGGETIYRIYLYSLPGVALILAPALTRLLQGGRLRALFGCAAVSAFGLAGLQGSLGVWYASLIPRSDVVLAAHLEELAGDDGRIIAPVNGFPREVTWHYVAQARSNTVDVPAWSIQNEFITEEGISSKPVDLLTYEASQLAPDQAIFVVSSSSAMRDYSAQYGTWPAEGFDELGRLLGERGWERIVDDEGTEVYTNPAGRAAWDADPLVR